MVFSPENVGDSPPTPEKSLKEVVLSSPEEQDAVFVALTSYLLTHTRHEERGLLTPELVDQNNLLRRVVKDLAVSMDKQLPSEEWLLLGVSDMEKEEAAEDSES